MAVSGPGEVHCLLASLQSEELDVQLGVFSLKHTGLMGVPINKPCCFEKTGLTLDYVFCLNILNDFAALQRYFTFILYLI